MPELEGKVSEAKTVYVCQRCSKITDNPSQICDACAVQKKLSTTGGLTPPKPTDFTSQNF